MSLTRKTRVKTSHDVRDNSLLPIPVDLVTDIFSRLSVKSIARCRCVSKLWASILRTPDFTELFLTRSSARPRLLFSCKHNDKLLFFSAPQVYNPHESSSLVAANYLTKFSSNTFFNICGTVCGLVCFLHVPFRRSDRVLVICNPSTGQSKTISISVYGFLGYDPIGRQFKLLSMNSSKEHKVLTSGTEKPLWRKTKCCIPHYPRDGCKGICINGILYYPTAVNRYSRDSMITCFDVRTEKYSFVKLMGGIGYYAPTLFNYKGKLASFSAQGFNFISGRSRSFEMWVLEDPEKHEWSKHVYSLPPMWNNIVAADAKFDFNGLTGTNEILLSTHYASDPFYIFYYNLGRKTIRRVEIQGLYVPNNFVTVHTFVDHVEDVKLMEMFTTYNLRCFNRS